MIVQQLENQKPFITKDGSVIRSILDRTNAPVAMQSLAEASLKPGQSTQRHYHKVSEEFYFLLEGTALMASIIIRSGLVRRPLTSLRYTAVVIPRGTEIKLAMPTC